LAVFPRLVVDLLARVVNETHADPFLLRAGYFLLELAKLERRGPQSR
jgi:hypothetical protein